MLEHYAGRVPLWLSPIQVVLTTITNDFDNYAARIFQEFDKNDVRAELDSKSEKISYKLRKHILEKVPIIGVLGAEEMKQNSLTLRYLNGDQETLKIPEAVTKVKNLCQPPRVL
jgi:threonyl-tRNA synthetase